MRAEILVFRPSVGTWYFACRAPASAARPDRLGRAGRRPVPGDYDGDRIIDVAVYRPQSGHWFFLKSTTNYSSNRTYQWGTTGDIPLPGDYDVTAGPTSRSTGRRRAGILKSSSNHRRRRSRVGCADDRPVPGDYDEDGKIDLGVYRPSAGRWFILLSSTNYTSWCTIQWGTTGDVLVPNDYDGDQKTDLAVSALERDVVHPDVIERL